MADSEEPTPEGGLEALLERPPAKVVIGPQGWIIHGEALGCLRPSHPFRHCAILTVEHWLFEPFIALVITLNCIELAWESPLDPPGTWKAHFIEQTEFYFLLIFTVEMLAKIVAYGFAFQPHSYLRDHYSQLDFLVVTLAWLPLILPGAANFTGLRTIRAMRPLRTLQYVPGMPMLVASIFQALSQLGSVRACIYAHSVHTRRWL